MCSYARFVATGCERVEKQAGEQASEEAARNYPSVYSRFVWSRVGVRRYQPPRRRVIREVRSEGRRRRVDEDDDSPPPPPRETRRPLRHLRDLFATLSFLSGAARFAQRSTTFSVFPSRRSNNVAGIIRENLSASLWSVSVLLVESLEIIQRVILRRYQ